MSERRSGRWGKLADIYARDPSRPIPTQRQHVWTDTETPYYHADSGCGVIFPTGYSPGRLRLMVSEAMALRTGAYRCWACYPIEAGG